MTEAWPPLLMGVCGEGAHPLLQWDIALMEVRGCEEQSPV